MRAQLHILFNAKMENGTFQCCAGSPKTWDLLPTWPLSSYMSLGVVSLFFFFFFLLSNSHFPLLRVTSPQFSGVTVPSPCSANS